MKKLLKYILPVVLIAFTVSSCSDKLELDPHQSVNADVALKDLTGLELALTGAYDAIQDESSYGQDNIQIGEVLTSEIYWDGSYNSYIEISNKALTTANGEASGLWIQAYDGINRVNRILEAIENGSVEESAEYDANKDRIKGEALFIRGILEYQLVTFFAKPVGSTADNSHLGVPIMLKATNNSDDAALKPARNTVAENYEQIISDLSIAAELLPDDNGNNADKFAAKGFLSRVYLMYGMNDEAAAVSNEVIASGKYELLDDITAFFTIKNINESVFEVQMTASDNLGGQNQSLANYWWDQERDEIHVPQAVIDRYEDGDARKTGWFYTANDKWYSAKYTDTEQNTPVLKYSEILLNRAEALAADGFNQEALDLVNQVRSRAGVADAVATTQEELVSVIRNERKLEFVHEGIRINDLKRWKEPIGYSNRSLEGQTVSWDDNSVVLPIPQREMDINENLIQNEGY